MDNYQRLCSSEASGLFDIGIKIDIATNPSVDLENKNIRSAGWDAARIIHEAVLKEIAANDDSIQGLKSNQRKQILSLFDGPIFVEEIPNGYSFDWYYSQFPWYVITTKIGRFKVGWRKHVINIDWSETIENTRDAQELFPDDDVTKGGKYIHAWTLKDAKRYIDTVFEKI